MAESIERNKAYWKDRPIDFNGTHQCRKCRLILNKTEFTVNRSTASGVSIYCKTCQKEKVRQSKLKYRIKWASQLPDLSGVKKCSACKLQVERSLFFIDRGTKDGLTSQCKSCMEPGNSQCEDPPQRIERVADITSTEEVSLSLSDTKTLPITHEESMVVQDNPTVNQRRNSLNFDVFNMGAATTMFDYMEAVKYLATLPLPSLLMLKTAVDDACEVVKRVQFDGYK